VANLPESRPISEQEMGLLMPPLVLDLTRLVPGPLAAQMLHCMGLRVLRVTAPTEDLLLQFAPDVYDLLQAGKETRMLDLKTTEGREMLLEMVQESAVLIESNLPGTMERLGLGPEVLRTVKPTLVYVRMAGYRDPSSNQCPGHDLTYLATAGLIRKLHSAWENIQIADLCGAFWTAMAALDGLRRGGGFYEVYLAEAAQALALPAVPFLDGSVCCYGIYRASDGHVALAALESHLWTRFCIAAGREEWTGVALLPANTENPVYVEICKVFSSRTAVEWEQWAIERRIPLRAVRGEPKAMAGPPWRMG